MNEYRRDEFDEEHQFITEKSVFTSLFIQRSVYSSEMELQTSLTSKRYQKFFSPTTGTCFSKDDFIGQNIEIKKQI